MHFLRRSLAAALILVAVPTLMGSSAGASPPSANIKTFCSSGARLAALLNRPFVSAKSTHAASTTFTTLHTLALTIETSAPSPALRTDFANLAASAQQVSKDANALKAATMANSLYEDSLTRRLGANLEIAVNASSPVAQLCPSFLFETLKGNTPPSTVAGSDAVVMDIGNQAVADANADSVAPTLTSLEGSMTTLGYKGVTLETYTLTGLSVATAIFIVDTADYSRFKTCLAFHGPGQTPTIC